jgi:[ribosomal protein S18]-alanine N-acetyltransferase
MSDELQPVSAASLLCLAEMHLLCFPEDPWGARTMSEILALPGAFGWIALREALPAGFVLGMAVGSECEILSLGVLPQQRRTGKAQCLLDAVCVEARRRHAERIVLEVAVDNSAALALYRKRGFAQVGRRPAYYRRGPEPIDALVLALPLAGSPLT